MATTPTNVSSSAFSIVQLSGADDYGSKITNQALTNWLLETFDDYPSGFLAPVIPPAQITQEPRLTFGGFLNDFNDDHLVGMAINATGSPSYVTANTVVPITIGYGRHTTASHGFETTGCFATRLNITGRMKQLVQFSADLTGLVTDVATLTLDTTPTMPEFYPFGKIAFSIGTSFDDESYAAKTTSLLGFSATLNTGYTPDEYSDGAQYYGNINEDVKVMDLELRMAHNATSMAEWAKWDGGTASAAKIVLTSTAGSSTVTIQVFGYYHEFSQVEEAGKLVNVGKLRAYWDIAGTTHEAFEITPA
jgi:hypothetical protein